MSALTAPSAQQGLTLGDAARAYRELVRSGRIEFERGYFVQQGADGPIKIGVANDARARITRLQTGSPLPLRILAVWFEPKGYEKRLHRNFVEHRIRGEWFHPAESILELARLHEQLNWFETRDARGENDYLDTGE